MDSESKKIKITEVSLDISIPNDSVGLVTMHPKLNLEEPGPFKSLNTEKQLQYIHETLEVAKRSSHKAEITHFTLFPEYSTPGLEGIEVIEKKISHESWHNNSIIIAGVDGLKNSEFQKLLSVYSFEPPSDLKIDQIPPENWINCICIWVKAKDGSIKRFLQTKLRAAYDEKVTSCDNLYEGDTLFLFKCKFESGEPCRFLSLICYDWVGKFTPTQNVLDSCLKELEKISEEGISLNWLFVLEHNPQPNHDDFLINARNFFNERSSFPKVNRDNCFFILHKHCWKQFTW